MWCFVFGRAVLTWVEAVQEVMQWKFSLNLLKLKMEAIRDFETLETTHPTTQPCIPEIWNLQHYRCKKLKYHKEIA